jgi:hypothetical protein
VFLLKEFRWVIFVTLVSFLLPGIPALAEHSTALDVPVVITGWEWCPMGYPCYEDSSPYPFSLDEHCEITIEGYNLFLTHYDAVYNCCIDDIGIEVIIDKDLIRVIESEIWSQPCYCFCYFETDVEIFKLKPGRYTVEVWCHWMSGEEALRCIEEVVIPGNCFSHLRR